MLGVLMDSSLTFDPLLKEMLAVGWSSFRILLHGAQAAGFSLPMVCDQVESRVVSVLLYPAAFLVCADGFVPKLNAY